MAVVTTGVSVWIGSGGAGCGTDCGAGAGTGSGTGGVCSQDGIVVRSRDGRGVRAGGAGGTRGVGAAGRDSEGATGGMARAWPSRRSKNARTLCGRRSLLSSIAHSTALLTARFTPGFTRCGGGSDSPCARSGAATGTLPVSKWYNSDPTA